LEFAEGDPFNRSLIVRGRGEINDLGFFSAVNITTAPGSSADKVVINIAVTETSTGEYGASAGYSTSDGILGEVSLTERNFLGRGQFLRAAIGASENGRTFDFSFTEPRFMGLKVSAGVDAYHRINDETDRSFYGTQATGGQLRFGVPITSDLSATVFAGAEQKVVSDEEGPISSFVEDGDEFYKAFAGYTLTWNGVDDTKKPTEGLYATFTQQYVGWDHSLIKSEARARYFVPVLEDSGIIGSIRGQAGIINDLSGDGVHPIEALSPGSQLVRGFEGRGYGPRLTTGEFVGATMYAGVSAELLFPIPVLPENYGLSGALWADAGWVDELPNIGSGTIDPGSQDEPLRTSIGASIIWDSPFGPLRGDFAHVLNKSTADETQVFQLSLQTLL
jgi:outer membrane protein insertion porin family